MLKVKVKIIVSRKSKSESMDGETKIDSNIVLNLSHKLTFSRITENMSDSSTYEAGNDYNNKAEDLEVVFDEEENQEENEDVFEITPRNRNLQRKPYLSRSVMNLATSSPYSPRSLSRSDSSSSLASPMGSLSALSPLPVSDIKNLTNDYQKLLKQATQQIKKLNVDVQKLEQEKAKILQANVDLALETKGLMLDQKAWKKDEQVK